jgi:protein-S-isoprenylcysteine O-methyltransferase Ste14
MEWFPNLKLGLLNGWILPAILYLSFGVLLAVMPRPVVARLYGRSRQEPRRVIPRILAVVLILAWLALSVLTPLRQGHAVLPIGLALYALGLAGFITALVNFAATPPDQPVTRGLYRISRHPQQSMISVAFLGASIAMGSWPSFLLMAVAVVGGHFRLVAEEKACIQQYGDAYREYMQRVPRYFLFF